MVNPKTRENTKESETEDKDEEEKQTAFSDEEEKCPDCGGNIIQEDSELICSDCSMVIEDSMIDHGPEWRAFNSRERDSKSRVGAPTTKTMHDDGLTTTIDWRDKDAYGKQLSSDKRRQMNRLRKWQSRIRTKDATERNLQFALSEIERMSASLGIPQNVREVASVLYRRCLDYDLIRGRSIEGVATACLYAACRREKIPRSMEEIESASRVSRKEIGRTYRYISQELELSMEPVDPKQYVPRFCSELNLPENVEAEAKRIIDIAKEAGQLSGKSPTGFAAAAIYAAALLCNEKRTQAEVAEVAQVTEVTIRNRYQEQINALGLKEFEDEGDESELFDI